MQGYCTHTIHREGMPIKRSGRKMQGYNAEVHRGYIPKNCRAFAENHCVKRGKNR
jgi:hypothetical protein